MRYYSLRVAAATLAIIAIILPTSARAQAPSREQILAQCADLQTLDAQTQAFMLELWRQQVPELMVGVTSIADFCNRLAGSAPTPITPPPPVQPKIDPNLTGRWQTECLVPDFHSQWAEQHSFTFRTNGGATHIRKSYNNDPGCNTLNGTITNEYSSYAIPSSGHITLMGAEGPFEDVYAISAGTLKLGSGFRSNLSYSTPLNEYLVYRRIGAAAPAQPPSSAPTPPPATTTPPAGTPGSPVVGTTPADEPLPPLSPPAPSAPLQPTTVIQPPTVTTVDINVTNVRLLAVDARIRVEGDISAEALAQGTTIVLTITSNPITRTIKPTTTHWVFDEVLAIEPGDHTLTVAARDAAGNTSAPVTRSFTIEQARAIAVAGSTVRTMKNFHANPTVQTVNRNAIAPIVAIAVIANTAAATAAAGVNLIILLRYLASFFTEPFLVLAGRRRKPWGVVYHALAKRPVDLAIVRAIDERGKVRSSRVTDRMGRFAFYLNPGTYRIAVTHPGYTFPSSLLKSARSDSAFDDLYHGESFALTERAGAITANVPVDPRREPTPAHAIGHARRLRIHTILAYTGPVLALASFGVSPTWPIGILLAVHLGMVALFRRLTVSVRPKAAGVVRDATTERPVAHAIARLFSAEHDKLIDTQVTSGSGRYGFLVGKGIFTLTVEHPGYATETVAHLDGARLGGVIAKDVELTPEA